MSFSVGNKDEYNAEPNVVPLCDVLLVLLIIFMVVTPLVQRGADVKLPTAMNTIDMPENCDMILYVKQDGTLRVNEEEATMDSLQLLLEDTMMTVTDHKLYLKADGELEYGTLVDLYEIIRAAGIDEIGIIVDKKTSDVH